MTEWIANSNDETFRALTLNLATYATYKATDAAIRRAIDFSDSITSVIYAIHETIFEAVYDATESADSDELLEQCHADQMD